MPHRSRRKLVQAVAIGRLDQDIVGPLDRLRILDQGLVQIADVAACNQLSLLASLLHPDLDARAAQHVACIVEPEADSFGQLDGLAILRSLEKTHRALRVLYRIDRNYLAATTALGLAVPPLRLHLLDVGAVVEHDLAQVRSRLGRPDGSTESFLRQKRKPAAMVDMGMGQEYRVDLGSPEQQVSHQLLVIALGHPTIDQDRTARTVQECATSRNMPRGTDKGNFHGGLSYREV